jgi:cob(I)alamin adenosyltransferase
MEKRKALQDAEVADKTITQKGLLIVHTGAGKGKSTAAFGLALRALAQGWKIGVVQFGKGAWRSGERDILEKLGDVSWHTLGEGFTWETQDRSRDIRAAEKAWAQAVALINNPEIGLVILDELNISLRYDHLPLAQVLAILAGRRSDLHIVVTGRNAKAELIEAADLVTEMTTPDWEPLMKISSGIITNKGGRTCHAAIVARELRLNAIVGVGNATEVLKDDDKVYPKGAAITSSTLPPFVREKVVQKFTSYL